MSMSNDDPAKRPPERRAAGRPPLSQRLRLRDPTIQSELGKALNAAFPYEESRLVEQLARLACDGESDVHPVKVGADDDLVCRHMLHLSRRREFLAAFARPASFPGHEDFRHAVLGTMSRYCDFHAPVVRADNLLVYITYPDDWDNGKVLSQLLFGEDGQRLVLQGDRLLIDYDHRRTPRILAKALAVPSLFDCANRRA